MMILGFGLIGGMLRRRAPRSKLERNSNLARREQSGPAMRLPFNARGEADLSTPQWLSPRPGSSPGHA
jgi:hypothetical protein